MGPSPPTTDPRADPRLGTTIAGRYRLLARLGAGGMGTVYEAEQLSTTKRVAVKVLQSGLGRIEVIRRRFEREALASSRLQHPNIVSVIDFGVTDDNGLFLAMELVKGESLGDILERGRPPAGRVLVIARQILEALRHAHAQGVVHRDLKPDNVMVVDTGLPGPERDLCKLLDFGIAKLFGDAEAEVGGDKLTQAGVAFGTPEYMSPEQALGETVDGRADLYAMGVMLFEMLSGRRPFEAEDKMALLKMHVAAMPPAMTQVAPDAASTPLLEAVVARALTKRREDRFASADEMLAVFDAAAVDFLRPGQGSGGGARGRAGTITEVVDRPAENTRENPAPPPVWRRRVAWMVAAAAVAAFVVGGVLRRCDAGAERTGVLATGVTQLVIGHAAAGAKRATASLDAYEAALAATPGLAADQRMHEDVLELATHAQKPAVRVRARALAEKLGVGDRIDWVESYALDLVQGETCPERREVIPRLRALKDKRAVGALKRARARGEVNACLDRDAREAIEFLEALP